MNPRTGFRKITILRDFVFKRIRRNQWAGASAIPMLLSVILIIAIPRSASPQCVIPPLTCPQSACLDDPGISPGAILGWDGDHNAVYAHIDGSYRVRDNVDPAGRCTTVGFSVYNDIPHPPGSVQWYNESGYLPALTTKFDYNSSVQVKITNFGDQVSIGYPVAYSYVAIYSRVSIWNHGRTPFTLCPRPSAGLIPLPPLRDCNVAIPPGQTVTYDYVMAVDRFGNTYNWPNDTDLAAAGSWDTHFANMSAYWNNKLAGIVNITQLPDLTLKNAYKAGYIYTHIVKDGFCLKVGEGPQYDYVFNHDEIGILVNLLELGDFTDAGTFLPHLGQGSGADDARYKYPWPWALYLEKTGDTGLVSNNFNCIYDAAHSIDTDRTGPGRIMHRTNAVDNDGFWTVDNWSALMGLAAYKYICNKLGNTAEETWATNEYNDLLTSVNYVLNSTMTSSNINYIPINMLASNELRDPKDFGWAVTFHFGGWAWDGYLFGAAQSGVGLTNIDNTYDAGFLAGRAAGVELHNFGGVSWPYPEYSTVYNAGCGSTALMGDKYRSEGIYAYQFMLSNGQSGPFSWHESFDALNPSDPWAGNHPGGFLSGDSPHMWGQAEATKMLIDSLIAERVDVSGVSNGSVAIIGRGVPNSWVANGKVIEVSNFPIANNNRMGFNLQGIASNQIRLTLTGATPTGGTVLDLRAFFGNIQSVTAGTIDNIHGTVTLPPGVNTTTVTLITPNPTPIPTPTPRPTPAYTPPVGATFIEAESGTRTGCYFQADSNASGGARVDGIDANGDNVAFTNFQGTSVIKIRYASPNNGTFGLYVNNIRVASIPITATAPPPQGWYTYGEKTINVTIPAGATVKFQYDNNQTIHDVAINLDAIVVGVIEMESGTPSAGVTIVPDYYASAGKRVDGLTGSTRTLTFNSFPATKSLALRYSSAAASDATLNVAVNGGTPQPITLPYHNDLPTGGGRAAAYTEQLVDVSIPLNAPVTFRGNTGSALYDSIFPVTKLEAEKATLVNCFSVPDNTASNGARVDGLDAPMHWVSFTSGVQGGSRLTFRYECAASYGLLNLYINNSPTPSAYVYFKTASSWADKTVAITIPPNATVKLEFDDATYNVPVSLDYIRMH
jgi:Carbohydrate binding module (family 6)